MLEAAGGAAGPRSAPVPWLELTGLQHAEANQLKSMTSLERLPWRRAENPRLQQSSTGTSSTYSVAAGFAAALRDLATCFTIFLFFWPSAAEPCSFLEALALRPFFSAPPLLIVMFLCVGR